MGHVVLLGDSIFDNTAYVLDRPPVIEQVRRGLPAGWKATLVAVDGNTVEDIAGQLTRIPESATHLVMSVGGNDALIASMLLGEPAETVKDALEKLAVVLDKFRVDYTRALVRVRDRGLPVSVCTIYNAIPGLSGATRAALAGFNDTITQSAVLAKIPIIDLRLICTHPDDYSPLSPIEPSVVGGAKIAGVICRVVTGHDFSADRTTVWI